MKLFRQNVKQSELSNVFQEFWCFDASRTLHSVNASKLSLVAQSL